MHNLKFEIMYNNQYKLMLCILETFVNYRNIFAFHFMDLLMEFYIFVKFLMFE